MLPLDIEWVSKGLGSSWGIGGVVHVVWLGGVVSKSVLSLSSGIISVFLRKETSSIESYAICFVSTLLGVWLPVYRLHWGRSVCWGNTSRGILVGIMGMRSPSLAVQ